MHHSRQKHFSQWPLRDLKRLHEDLAEIIRAREASPPLEVDIGIAFAGQEERVAEILDREPHRPGVELRLQTIRCADSPCPKCPHGPFWYYYPVGPTAGRRRVRYRGRSWLDADGYRWIQEMEKRCEPPKWVGDIRLVSDGERRTGGVSPEDEARPLLD